MKNLKVLNIITICLCSALFISCDSNSELKKQLCFDGDTNRAWKSYVENIDYEEDTLPSVMWLMFFKDGSMRERRSCFEYEWEISGTYMLKETVLRETRKATLTHCTLVREYDLESLIVNNGGDDVYEVAKDYYSRNNQMINEAEENECAYGISGLNYKDGYIMIGYGNDIFLEEAMGGFYEANDFFEYFDINE